MQILLFHKLMKILNVKKGFIIVWGIAITRFYFQKYNCIVMLFKNIGVNKFLFEGAGTGKTETTNK